MRFCLVYNCVFVVVSDHLDFDQFRLIRCPLIKYRFDCNVEGGINYSRSDVRFMIEQFCSVLLFDFPVGSSEAYND